MTVFEKRVELVWPKAGVKVFSCAAVIECMSTYCEIDGYHYLVPDLPDEYESVVAVRPDEPTVFWRVVNRSISCLALAKRDLEGLVVTRLISDIFAARAAVVSREVSRAADLTCKLRPFTDLQVAPGLPAADACINLSARILPSPIA